MSWIDELLAHRSELLDVVHEAGTRLFAPIFRPGFAEAAERSVAKQDTTAQPVSVVVAQVPVKLAERDTTRLELRIFNLGANTIHVSGSDRVSGAAGDQDAGYPVLTNSELRLTKYVGEVWAVSAAGNNDVRVFDQAGG